MNKCLITQLKGTVVNDDLYGINSVQFISSANNQSFGVQCKSTITIKSKRGTFKVQNTETDLTTYMLAPSNSTTTFIIANAGTIIEVYDKQNVTLISSELISTNDVEYMLSLNTIAFGSGSIDKLSRLVDLQIINGFESVSVKGSVSVLTALPVRKVFLNNTSVEGNIVALATNVINNIHVANTNVDGAVESFITALLQTTNNSRSVSFHIANSYVTMGGETITNSNAKYLIFESASRFVIASSSTIAESSILYAKGYTDEEVDAWIDSGKTVYVRN